MTEDKTQGFERFQWVMSTFAASYVEPAWKQHKAGSRLKRNSDAAFAAVFQGYVEISNALEALKLCETLIRLAPPRAKAVRPDEYFKFLIGAYLQEVYILEERLSAYATKMSRLYKAPQLKAPINELLRSFEKIRDARGAHVHAERFSDEEMDRLSLYMLASQADKKWIDHAKDQYQWAQLTWTKTAKALNASAKLLVDMYFDILYPVMTQEDEIVLPKSGLEPSKALSS